MTHTIFTTDERPYPHYGLKSYRIEMDISNPRLAYQRHIWTYEGGHVRADRWISSHRPLTEAQLMAEGRWTPVDASVAA